MVEFRLLDARIITRSLRFIATFRWSIDIVDGYKVEKRHTVSTWSLEEDDCLNRLCHALTHIDSESDSLIFECERSICPFCHRRDCSKDLVVPSLDLRSERHILIGSCKLIYIKLTHITELACKEHLHFALLSKLYKLGIAGHHRDDVTCNYRRLLCVTARKRSDIISILVIEHDE